MADNALRASIVATMGATGSMKSTAIRLALDADAGERRLIFDFKGEYLKYGVECKTVDALWARLLKSWAGPFSLVLRPSFDVERGREQFNWLCGLAYKLGRVLVVGDELHRVTRPGWAPANWNMLVSMGRDRGVRIIAASQRPTEFAPVFWDQATVIRGGRLNSEASARTLGGVLMVPWREVMALAPGQWIQRSIERPVIVRGHIAWRSDKPVEVVDSEINLVQPASGQ
jgi:hypothetical protein